jgi:NADPH:quinone reductase-like Zn-dependent oxidoreductase
MTAMRAVVLPRPGPADVLELRELEVPDPAEHEVLVRVRAATITRGDVALRHVPRLMWPVLCIGGPLERGAIRPAIDRSYPLERIGEAHRYVEGGHTVGKVVITLGPSA